MKKLIENKKVFISVIGVILILIIGIVGYLFLNEKKYVVSFDTDGGSIIESIKVKKGSELVLPDSPSKDGYVFNGWVDTDSNIINNGYVVKSDLKLFAKWVLETAKTFTVSFDSKGGSEVASIIIEDGKELKLPSNPTRSGYKFIRWVDVNETPILDGALLSCEDITLYAVWEKIVVEESAPPKKTEYKYTCPSGYTLKDTKCEKYTSSKATYACPSGTKEVDGKCYTISSRKDATITCASKNVHVGKGSTPIIQGELIVIPNAYSYCVFGVVSDSYEQENQTNCTSRGHVWANNKCYYEKGSPSEYKEYSCKDSGYVYVANPTNDIGANGANPGCFKVDNKAYSCPSGSEMYSDPYVGKMCKALSETIDATKEAIN